MFLVTYRNLFQEKTRLLISVGGVAFSVLMIMVLVGLYRGWSFKMGEYIRTIPADFWVEQAGGTDMFHSVSILPADAQSQIEQINGVSSVKPFKGRRVATEINSKETIVYLVGYDDNTGAAPVRIVEGRATPAQGEIILDRSVAKDKGIKIGDELSLGEYKFEVAGIAEGGNLVTLSYAFVSAADAEALFQLPNVVNYYIVRTKPGADKTGIAQDIETGVPGSRVVSKQQFIDDNTELIRETFLPIILVLVLISLAVGTAVIALTIFTSTIEKAKEYGVLKAVGVRNRQLYGIVTEQSLIAAMFGYFIGSGLAMGLSYLAGRLVVEFVTLLKLGDALWILGLTIIMAILAAFLPTRRLARIDPAEVFRA